MTDKYEQLKKNIRTYTEMYEPSLFTNTLDAVRMAIVDLQEENANFITTIESQKEEIESLTWKVAHPVICQGICTSQLDDYCGMHMSNETCIACNSIWTEAHIENAVFSYKAITELAVKGLKRVINIEDEPSKPCIKCNNHGYHHGFGSDGRDPDYCADCGGLGEIFVGQTEVAADALSEIERLQNAQT